MDYVSIKWSEDKLLMLDQRKLPLEETYVEGQTIEDILNGIKDMVVRGAPLIGFTGIFGMAFWVRDHFNDNDRESSLLKTADYLKSARPTAVNLAFEIDNVTELIKEKIAAEASKEDTFQMVLDFAFEQVELIKINNQRMADLAADHLKNLYGDRPLNVMTLCNTGFLACGPMGTALGVISNLKKLGRINMVYASETRPYLQGSRLTSYELRKEGVDHQIVVEGAHSYLLENKNIDAIFIGADRIVSNGDTANKVGSSSLSIIAKHYDVPFFVVAPTSSFDLSLDNGSQIEIEMRPEEEILAYKDQRIAPEGARALNPSFDISRADFIRGIFCEKGEIHPVTKENVCKTLELS